MTFNEWIVQIARKKFRGSSAVFAHAVGVSRSSVCAYLRGRSVPFEDTLRKIIEASGEKMPPDVLDDYKERVKMAREKASGFGKWKKDTLCWDCANAVPDNEHGCSWSRKFIPVDGWKAKPSRLENHHAYTKVATCSFIVYECPLFERDTDEDLDTIDGEKLERWLNDAAGNVEERALEKKAAAEKRHDQIMSAHMRYYYRNRDKLCRKQRERYWKQKLEDGGD